MTTSSILPRAFLLRAAAAMLLCGAGNALAANTPATDTKMAVHIRAQPVREALQAFGEQTGLQVLFRSEGVSIDGLMTPAVSGQLSAREALERLLASSGLKYEFVNERTVRVSVAAAESLKADTAAEESKHPLGVTRDQGGSPQAVEKGNQGETGSSQEGMPPESATLEEIVVTGTHIRGVTESVSPVLVFTREDFDRMGIATVQGLVEKIPQNFGSASENSVGLLSGNVSASNSTSATGVDLRGIGNDATLVLVNGRRLAAGGPLGNIVDVSMIPLSAVERVEVLTDGASAIYGADAVGGVINFILRRDFKGAETQLRYGSVTDGSSHEVLASQLFGSGWDGGSAVISYEYSDRTPLSTQSREVSRTAEQPSYLLPEQTRHSAFVSAQHALSQNINLFADGTFAKRHAISDTTTFGNFTRYDDDITSYSATIGSRIQLTSSLSLEVDASYAGSETESDKIYDVSRVVTGQYLVDTDVLSFDAKVDGTLWSLPGGKISYAAGAQFRREQFSTRSIDFSPLIETSFKPERSVSAGFIELRLPLVAGDASTGGVGRLELSLADRYEHYDDFASANNPQLGVFWKPSRSLKLRGTIGTSFKAPLLNDTSPAPSVTAFPLDDPAPGSDPCYFTATNTCTNALLVSGGNPDLSPEDATTWTVGFDLQPAGIERLKISANYFNIKFKDRIVFPGSLISSLDALTQESLLGSGIVQRDPSQLVVDQLVASASDFSDFVGDLTVIGAIVDFRMQNLSTVRTSGFDLSASYGMDVLSGVVDLGLDGTYILKYENQFSENAPSIEFLNRPYNPVDLKLRAHANYERGSFGAGLSLNYVDAYHDPLSTPVADVASWTTVDIHLSYEVTGRAGFANGIRALVGARNIADKLPPFVSNPYGINFDGNNANAVGRFWFAQLSKRW